MAYYTRKTFNDAFSGESPLQPNDGPSGTLQFMRNRRRISLRGVVIAGAMSGFTMGMSNVAYFGWSGAWYGLSAPSEIGRATVKAAKFFQKLGGGRPEFATPMIDTRQAYTMRQASLQAMHDSAYSLRGAIGNEARLLHS